MTILDEYRVLRYTYDIVCLKKNVKTVRFLLLEISSDALRVTKWNGYDRREQNLIVKKIEKN